MRILTVVFSVFLLLVQSKSLRYQSLDIKDAF